MQITIEGLADANKAKIISTIVDFTPEFDGLGSQ